MQAAATAATAAVTKEIATDNAPTLRRVLFELNRRARDVSFLRPHWRDEFRNFASQHALGRNYAFEDGERGRLDRSRRRPADEPAALALTH